MSKKNGQKKDPRHCSHKKMTRKRAGTKNGRPVWFYICGDCGEPCYVIRLD